MTYTPPPPPLCVCGIRHRSHMEQLAPAGAPVAIALDAVEDHQLVAFDATAQICSCGARHRSQLEHLADVALGESAAASARIHLEAA